MNRKIRSSVSAPKGVGGWLLLLIVMLAVYTPVMGFRNLYYDFIVSARALPALEANQAWVQYRMVVWVIFAIMCFFCLAAGYALWRIKRPMTVQLAIAQTIKPFYVLIAASAIQCAIWTGYLLRSSRVKNTYYPADSGLKSGK